MDQVTIEQPRHIEIAKICVTRPVTRSQRAKVIRFYVTQDALVSSREVSLESPGHPSSVKPLSPMVRVGETLVHINVRIVKMQN
jgi:hypothetical protein